jgi:1-deoxy-D-xylulose-5-phosphate reductoisomerase
VKRVVILGSTGSIGQSALAVVAAHAERVLVTGLAAGGNAERFAEQVRRFRPAAIAMASKASLDDAVRRLGDAATSVAQAGWGSAGMVALATRSDVDIVLCASSGTAALEAVLAAIEAGKTIALANKEVLVMAGRLVTDAARRRGVAILPVDSEHNAIHQCLHGRARSEITRLILTASGGPFRESPLPALARMTPEEALRHPTWKMGPKITIDSATMMNKGLEVIEAHWLFDVDADRIQVLIHPQSVVHSMVELTDGSVIAQLGVTDMRLPIQYAFSYPDRWQGSLPSLDLAAAGRLEFETPDDTRFPCLGLAYRALRAGGVLPISLNAANEVAVDAFLGGLVTFTDIARVIEQTLDRMDGGRVAAPATLAEVRAVDAQARAYSQELLRGLQSS